MKCPHCTVHIHEKWSYSYLSKDVEGDWGYYEQKCPECGKLILLLACGERSGPGWELDKSSEEIIQVYPTDLNRTPAPSEVPDAIAKDYREACLVLRYSPQASAALSRRCLQHILSDAGQTKARDLVKQIEEVVELGRLPSHVTESLDAVRILGNMAAHPTKSKHTGEIVPVEPGEAEWNLDVIESLFDYYYVQPAALQKKREALNAKLQQAGKQPLPERTAQ